MLKIKKILVLIIVILILATSCNIKTTPTVEPYIEKRNVSIMIYDKYIDYTEIEDFTDSFIDNAVPIFKLAGKKEITKVRYWPNMVINFGEIEPTSIKLYEYSVFYSSKRNMNSKDVRLIFNDAEFVKEDNKYIYNYKIRHSSESDKSMEYNEVEERGYILNIYQGEEIKTYAFIVYHDGSHDKNIIKKNDYFILICSLVIFAILISCIVITIIPKKRISR